MASYTDGSINSWAAHLLYPRAGGAPNLSEGHAAAAFGVTNVAVAFAVLLHRYTGQDEVVLEVRSHDSGLEKSSEGGLRLQADFSQNPSFAELQRQWNGPIERSDVEANGTQFLVTRELQNGLTSPTCALDPKAEEHLLRLTLVRQRDNRGVVLEYWTGEFESQAIAQLSRHLEVLLKEATANPSMRSSEVQLLQGQERHQVLVEWNNTARKHYELSVPELFALQAQRTPDRAALIHGEERLNFRQLNEQANRLAHYLRGIGVGPGVFVGVCLENSIRATVTVLGIVKAGGVFVPLDPSYPEERVKEIVKDAALKVIATADRHLRKDSFPGIRFVDISHDQGPIGAESIADLQSGCGPDDAIYIAYTSGSTGEPVGVIGIHRSITNALHETLFDATCADEVCCLNGSMAVSFMIPGMFLPLLSGIPLVLLSSAQYQDPMRLLEVIEEAKVTTLALPTPALRQIFSMGERVTSRLGSLHVVQVGGATVTPDLVEASARLLPRVTLLKAYGSSEIGGMATRGPATSGNSVGRPVTNTRVFILDKALNPVPVGVTGEIYVAAQHLARGYVNRPELTAARFLPDPFGNDSGGRIYRTGDLGRFAWNGDLEFLGRADDQVKVRGYRVQLGAIETALDSHPAVRETAISVREMENEQRLVAHVIFEPGANIGIRQLREHLSQRLPEYMIPAAFVVMDRFPRTAGGKVDRKALPAPPDERPRLESEYVEPRTPEEAFLSAVWTELLGIGQIGVHDNFLELGGDSLFAVQVIARVWNSYRVELALSSLFEHPTIAELATEIQAERDSDVVGRKEP